jgi:hypothetical protein
MKIKPSTLFLLLAALLLGGVALIVQQQSPPPPTEAAKQQPIFSFQEKQVQAVTLQTQLRSLKFERDKTGKWQMIEPEKTAASDSSIAFLLDLLATGKSDRSFSAPVANQKQYGFQQPLAVIEVKLDNQETHKLILGEHDFNRSFIYAQADPAAAPEAMRVLLVSPNFENAVSRPLAEWKQAADQASPKGTPSPSSQASPPATPQATPSPSDQANPASPEPSPKAQEQASPEPPKSNSSPFPGTSSL